MSSDWSDVLLCKCHVNKGKSYYIHRECEKYNNMHKTKALANYLLRGKKATIYA